MNYWGRNEGIQTAPKITDGNFLTSSTLCMKIISLFSNIQIKKKKESLFSISYYSFIPSSLYICTLSPSLSFHLYSPFLVLKVL